MRLIDYKQLITKISDQISHDDPTHSENSERKLVVHGDDNLYFEMTLRKVAIAWSTNAAVSVVTMYHLQGLQVQVSGHIGKISCPQMHQTSSPRLITAEARGSVCSSIWCIWTKSVHLSIGHYPMPTNMYHVPKMPEIGAKAPKKHLRFPSQASSSCFVLTHVGLVFFISEASGQTLKCWP